RNPLLVVPFTEEPGRPIDDIAHPLPPPDGQGTNLAAAVEASAGAMPPAYVPKIVLITDGNSTAGDALKAALAAKIPIDTVALATRSDPEVQLSAVKAPAQVREGEPFYMEVLLDANHEDEGLIEIYRGAHKVFSRQQKLAKGENRLRFQQSVTGERLAHYTVRVSNLAQDTLLDNNTESALVFTAGKPKVLLVESDPKQAQ